MRKARLHKGRPPCARSSTVSPKFRIKPSETANSGGHNGFGWPRLTDSWRGSIPRQIDMFNAEPRTCDIATQSVSRYSHAVAVEITRSDDRPNGSRLLDKRRSNLPNVTSRRQRPGFLSVLDSRGGYLKATADRCICLTNNAAERALRGFVLGRKSWLFRGRGHADHDRLMPRSA